MATEESHGAQRPMATEESHGAQRPMATPTVTVAIPTLNEAAHIVRVLDGFLSAGDPYLLEVVVADGGSTDGTRERVLAVAAADPRVRLIDNPDRIQSAGLNRILAVARGEVFLRADAHCHYAEDYVAACVEALLASGALNVGGAQRFVAEGAFQAGLALASRSLLGTGGARYRDPAYDGFADTVFLGCFWRETLESLAAESGGAGPFDTTQVTNQDAELNMRLLARRDEAIYVSSRIRVWYFPRPTPALLFKQYLRYGRGRYMSGRKHPGRSPWRSRAPFLGAALLTAAVAADALLTGGHAGTALWVVVAGVLPFGEAFRVARRHGAGFEREFWRGAAAPPGPFRRWLACGLALALMPLAHASGFAYQALRHRLARAPGW